MSTDSDNFINDRSELIVKRAESAYVPRPPFPENLMMDLSNACNHQCIFCANPKMTRKRRSMNEDLARSVMAQAYDLGAREIGFYTTGDPFIHPKLSDFVAEAKRLGFQYTYVSTNGGLATPDRAKKVIDAGLDSIKFSINALSRETYKIIHGKDDRDTVFENLRYVCEYRKTLERPLRVGITFVVTRENAHEVDEMRALWEPRVDDMMFPPVNTQEGNMLENADSLDIGTSHDDSEESTGYTPCFLPFSRAHVNSEGYLTLCCVDYQNYLAVADLNRVSLKEAWESNQFEDIRRRHLENRLKGTLCHNCLCGKQEPIEPLVHELATLVDFGKASRDNQQTQEERMTRTPSSSECHVASAPLVSLEVFGELQHEQTS